MIAALLATIGSRLVRRALRVALAVVAVVLLLLAFRRSGERLGRLLERLEAMENANDVQREMLDAAARRPRDRGELARRRRDGQF